MEQIKLNLTNLKEPFALRADQEPSVVSFRNLPMVLARDLAGQALGCEC